MSEHANDEFERGRIHEKVREHDRRLQAINGSIDRAEAAINKLSSEVAKISVKVGIASAVAALVGSAATGVVVTLVTKG